MKIKPQFIHRRKIEFSETDMAGIAHFSNFYRWMEAAEVEWFEQLGHSLIETSNGIVHGWPRVRSQCDFHAPVYFRDEIAVHLLVKELKIRALEYSFRFYKATGEDEPLHVATGSMTTVFAQRDPATGQMSSADLPVTLLRKIEAAIAPGDP